MWAPCLQSSVTKDALSCGLDGVRWLSAQHCDPHGFHLSRVAEVARAYLDLGANGRDRRGVTPRSPLRAAFEAKNAADLTDFALFWGAAHRLAPITLVSTRSTTH